MIDSRSNLSRAWGDMTDPDAGLPVRLISLGFLLSHALLVVAVGWLVSLPIVAGVEALRSVVHG